VVASTGTTPNSRLYVGEFDTDLDLLNLRARGSIDRTPGAS